MTTSEQQQCFVERTHVSFHLDRFDPTPEMLNLKRLYTEGAIAAEQNMHYWANELGRRFQHQDWHEMSVPKDLH